MHGCQWSIHIKVAIVMSVHHSSCQDSQDRTQRKSWPQQWWLSKRVRSSPVKHGQKKPNHRRELPTMFTSRKFDTFLSTTRRAINPTTGAGSSGLPAIFVILLLAGCGSSPEPPVADDEAYKRALAEGQTAKEAAQKYFTPSTDQIKDYFKGMDSLSPRQFPHQLLESAVATEADVTNSKAVMQSSPRAPQLEMKEVFGRNTWMIWCAGNEGFWDDLSRAELGFIDLVKLLDSRNRTRRFADAGMINEPGMEQAREGHGNAFGLWLDQPTDGSVRRWRDAYLKHTFDLIGKGVHKSQRGLPVYRGVADEKPTEDGYDPPESYMTFLSGNLPTKNSYAMERNSNTELAKEKSEYDYSQLPPPDIYGLSSGVVGLRLFPNPYFDDAARAKWDAAKYYDDSKTDDSYYRDPKLVRPFRVGMACAFCHASWHPLNPPADFTSPQWANISGNIGAQYLRTRATFGNLLPENNFVYHVLDSQPPGTIDTSLIASDNINNPNAMNAVFRLPERVLQAFRNPHEQLSEASARLPSIWESPEADAPEAAQDRVPEAVRQLIAENGLGKELDASNSAYRAVPRVLIDGADSIGAWGSLARVYLNIGSYWERWNQLHQPVLGLTQQKPFALLDCEQHSVYWNASRLRVGPLRDYFLKASSAMPLLAAPNAQQRLQPIDEQQVEIQAAARGLKPVEVRRQLQSERIDVTQLAHGRKVFARNCIVCHSSIQPESSLPTFFGAEDDPAKRTEYQLKFTGIAARRMSLRRQWADSGEFFEHDPGQWLQDAEYQEWALDAVERPRFWTNNYLSTDYRIPITLVRTNPGRAMGTNALTGHMWSDFSSESYRQLPSPGLMEFFNPYAGPDGSMQTFSPRHKTPPGAPEHGGGPGYYRVPSLVSIWATAPYLHNNSVGLFNNNPSVNGRLEAFDDGIRKLLWPELRQTHSSYNGATPDRLKWDQGLIWRTTLPTYLVVSAKNVPQFASRIPVIATLRQKLPWLETVNPLWLPSAILMTSALVLLIVSNVRRRSCVAWMLIVAGVTYAGTYLLAGRYSSWVWLQGIREIRPPWFVTITLLASGVILLLSLSRYWIRFVGYVGIVFALGIGLVVYFVAGRLDDLRLGPIPAGTPVNLLANLNSEAEPTELKKAIRKTIAGLSEIESRHLEGEDKLRVLREQVAPALLEVNKCPDFVMDKGHYFEWFSAMTDNDKNALIELLKTF
jgi:mono/diheme cytochrome c family protein